jgi:hypothetical protein
MHYAKLLYEENYTWQCWTLLYQLKHNFHCFHLQHIVILTEEYTKSGHICNG